MEDKLFSVEKQVVLVCGASRGIGRALAEGFAARGAQVVIAGRNSDTLTQTAKEISTGAKAVKPLVCDVAVADDISSLVETTLAEFSRIDTLVSVAGVNTRMKAEDYSVDEYEQIVNVNQRGSERQPARQLLAGTGGWQAHDRAQIGQHHQHRFAEYLCASAGRYTVRNEQGWRIDDDARTGKRMGASRRTCKFNCTGILSDRNIEEALGAGQDARLGHRQHAVGQAWRRQGSGRSGNIPCVGCRRFYQRPDNTCRWRGNRRDKLANRNLKNNQVRGVRASFTKSAR